MTQSLQGKKILILVANGVDETSMSTVQRELQKTGATIKTAGIEPGLVNSWNNNAWGLYFPVDQQINTTLGSDFDCLIVPSGSRGITKLGTNAHSERIIASFIEAGKKMVFVGDAIELLAKVSLASGWNVTGPSGVKGALVAAGANWQGGEECIHNILMTSETQDSLGFVNNAIAFLAQDVEIKAAA